MRKKKDMEAGRLFLMRKQFTLVEMLVVIAVIGILAALLLPSLQRALAVARTGVCANNQKQLGTAFALYANDYAGWIPGPQVYGNKPGGTMPWSVLYTDIYRYGNPQAGVYIRQTEIFYCPSGYVPPTGYSWQGTCTTWYTYGIVVAGLSGSWAGVPWDSWTTVKDLGGWKYERWYNPSRCRRPSSLALVADTVTNSGSHVQASEWQPKSVYNNIRVQTRHNLAANFLFPDGHVLAVTADEFPTRLDITRLCTQEFVNIDY